MYNIILYVYIYVQYCTSTCVISFLCAVCLSHIMFDTNSFRESYRVENMLESKREKVVYSCFCLKVFENEYFFFIIDLLIWLVGRFWGFVKLKSLQKGSSDTKKKNLLNERRSWKHQFCVKSGIMISGSEFLQTQATNFVLVIVIYSQNDL